MKAHQCVISLIGLKSNVVHFGKVCSNAYNECCSWLNGQFIGWFELMSWVKFNELAVGEGCEDGDWGENGENTLRLWKFPDNIVAK